MATQRYALLSLTDKEGAVDFAKGLLDLGFLLLSTGGTSELLKKNGVAVEDVSHFTGFPEILDGRVKTLHPRVHGSILWDRRNQEHQDLAKRHDLVDLSVVAVNLYAFTKRVQSTTALSEAIEAIDIGGPTLLRAAAKNYNSCLAVIDPLDYSLVLKILREKSDTNVIGLHLAHKVFSYISTYDKAVAEYFASKVPDSLENSANALQKLRYGENSHQSAWLCRDSHSNDQPHGFAAAKIHQGKELSYNNYLDLDAAVGIVRDIQEPAVVIVKHTNPCGAATSAKAPLNDLFRWALACDSKSAFGGIVALNRTLDGETAKCLTEIFLECIIAPEVSPEALVILSAKKNLRVITGCFEKQTRQRLLRRSILGAELLQSSDDVVSDSAKWNLVTTLRPTTEQTRDLIFAEIVGKHVKSNAVVYVSQGRTHAIGAGQMSRIDSALIAERKSAESGLSLSGTVVASEAFFPFRDTVDLLARQGVKAILQPGGSMRDQESIDAANSAGIAMVFTGIRHFKH